MPKLSDIATHVSQLSMRIVLPLGLLLVPAGAQHTHHCCRISEPQPTLEKTYKISGAPQLVISNISGPIHVIGDSSGEIRLSAAETIRGDNDDDVARAKREVHLDIEQTGNSLAVCVNGPFRHGASPDNSACRNSNIDDDVHYSVLFAFELHVPAATTVRLKTINDGDVKVERLSGGFELNNINGRIELDQVTGAGNAKTINGDVQATFATNPVANCSFSTLNGSVHMYFRPNLAADLRYKTLNGDVYTDFATIPATDASSALSKFRGGRSSTGRVGSGGPQIDLDTLNGNIFIHRAS